MVRCLSGTRQSWVFTSRIFIGADDDSRRRAERHATGQLCRARARFARLARMLGASQLPQAWPRPSAPRPIVIVGAGAIVENAHLPAYRRLGFEVAGLFDLN